MNRSSRMLVVLAGAAILAIGFGGCKSDPPAAKQQDVASFKGGPMPPEAKAKMEAALQAAKDKSAQNSGVPH